MEDSDEESDWPQRAPLRSVKRGPSSLLNSSKHQQNKHGTPASTDIYSIRKSPQSKRASPFNTPLRSSLGINNLIQDHKAGPGLEAIDDSDSDTEADHHDQQQPLFSRQHPQGPPFHNEGPIGEHQELWNDTKTSENQQGAEKHAQAEERGPGQYGNDQQMALHTPQDKEAATASPSGRSAWGPSAVKTSHQAFGTPFSAQRSFLASHLKPGMLSTVSSSARRPEAKKGLGPLGNQLQQALKKRSEPAYHTRTGTGMEFIVTAARQSQDLWITSCSLVEGTVSASLQMHSQAFVIFKQQVGLEVYPQMKLKSLDPPLKFEGPDGLYICLTEFTVIV